MFFLLDCPTTSSSVTEKIVQTLLIMSCIVVWPYAWFPSLSLIIVSTRASSISPSEKVAWAKSFVTQLSRSRIFVLTWEAIVSKNFGFMLTLFCFAFAAKIATRVSKSGGWISACKPDSKRERSLS